LFSGAGIMDIADDSDTTKVVHTTYCLTLGSAVNLLKIGPRGPIGLMATRAGEC
jgi:hypothetical protein